MLPINFLNRELAARYCTERGLKVAPSTLGKMATVGGGPDFRKWGRLPVYEPAALDRWIESRLSAPKRSSSEAA